MGPQKAKSRSFDVVWSYQPRVATEILGTQKYTTTPRAVAELVANAFDAEATRTDVSIEVDKFEVPTRLSIQDNGHGMTPDDISGRFGVVGVPTGSEELRLGRLGVGRLAVHRIGSLSRWTTVSHPKPGHPSKCHFVLSDSSARSFRVDESVPGPGENSGTTIVIENLRDIDLKSVSPEAVADELVAQFCGYLLGNSSKRVFVNGEALDVASAISSLEEVDLVPQTHAKYKGRLKHVLLKRSSDRARFPGNLLFGAKGRTITAIQTEEAPTNTYVGLVDCPHLEQLVTSGREAVIRLDEGFTALKDHAIGAVKEFAGRYVDGRVRTFIHRARQQDFYPYRDAPSDPVTEAKQALYDVVLERLNERVNIERMTDRQQEVMFGLLRRAMDNENIQEILSEVAKLSDKDAEQFREVLERTTLQSIVRMSSEVTGRLQFLNVLHELTYGDLASRLRERGQLHRILEPSCWLFGSRFHLATSNRSFRKVIQKHRQLAGLPGLADPDIDKIAGVADIPDLFLASEKESQDTPQHQHVLVEIKRPSVSLGKDEFDQLVRYGQTIAQSEEFDHTNTRWDLFLVSSGIEDYVERMRKQKDKPIGLLQEWDNMTLWAFRWSEVIARARGEMELVRRHLEEKSSELGVSEYLKKNFPEVLEELSKKAKPTVTPARA